MSWFERWDALIDADSVRLTRRSPLGRIVASHSQLYAEDGDVPRPACIGTALQACRGENLPRFAAITAQISDRHVRYLNVPWQDGLSSEQDWSVLAALRFREVHGEQAAHWQVRLTHALPGQIALAAAIDTALITGVETLLPKLKLKSLQPRFVVRLNRALPRLPRAGAWFASIEDQRIVLAKVRGGTVESIRNEAIAGEAQSALSALLRRCAPLQESGNETLPLWLHDDSTQRVWPEHLDGRALRALKTAGALV